MKQNDFFPGIFLLAVSVSASLAAYNLGLGNIHKPGSGLIPFGTSVLLGLMSLGLLFKKLFLSKEPRHDRKTFEGIQWGRLILVLGGLIGYATFFNFLGFIVSTFLFMALLLGVIGRRSWWLTLVTSFLIVASTYLIFVVWLNCQFPKGFLNL